MKKREEKKEKKELKKKKLKEKEPVISKKPIKKELSKEQKEKIAKEKRIKNLQATIKAKLDKFAMDHKTYLPCFPDGRRIVGGEIKSSFFWQHIYLCKSVCHKKCRDFLAKSYICREIGCNNYPVCALFSEEKRKIICKKKFLLDQRKKLNSVYDKYFNLYQIYRGLKIDPDKTIKYLEQQTKKKREEAAKNPPKEIKKKIKKETTLGQIPDKKDRKKRSVKRKK